MALAFSACQKEAMTDTQSLENQDTGARLSGVVADNPKDVAKIPVTISSEFAKNGIHSSNVAVFAGRRPSPADLVAPTVTITSPASSSSVNGTVNITATATDNVGVKSVSFTVNNGTAISDAIAPYASSYNFVNDGSYTITARAVDAAGNTGTHSIVVSKTTVIIITPPPPATLPTSKILVTPPVLSQGGEGSCVTMAVSAQRSIEQYYRTNATSYSTTTNIVSPEFLYNQTKADIGCGSSASLPGSMSFIMMNGVCTWNSLPYSSLNGCDPAIITTSMRTEAVNYKIPAYHSILASDATAIKTSIVNNHPVSFTFQMDSNFYNSYPGYIWNTRGTLMATHALAIVGYDDAKRAYKALNGWGTSWGDQGFIWIDYNFFPTIVGYTYAMD